VKLSTLHGLTLGSTPGSANVPQAAAVKPQTWGQMFSSWFLPSAPPVNVQAANKSTSSSMKGNDTPSSLVSHV